MPELNINYWVLQTIAMLVTVWLIPRLTVTSIFGALGAVIALAFVNSSIWDAALFFNIPDSFSVHALLLLLANGFIFWVIVKLLPGIEVEGFLPALIAPIVFTISSVVIAVFFKDTDWLAVAQAGVLEVRRWRAYFQHTGGA